MPQPAPAASQQPDTIDRNNGHHGAIMKTIVVVLTLLAATITAGTAIGVAIANQASACSAACAR